MKSVRSSKFGINMIERFFFPLGHFFMINTFCKSGHTIYSYKKFKVIGM